VFVKVHPAAANGVDFTNALLTMDIPQYSGE
jgi:hypothetical protein